MYQHETYHEEHDEYSAYFQISTEISRIPPNSPNTVSFKFMQVDLFHWNCAYACYLIHFILVERVHIVNPSGAENGPFLDK